MRPVSFTKLSLLIFGAVAVAPGLSLAKTTGGRAQPPAQSAPATPQPGGAEMPAAVRAVLERAVREYAKVESYRDLTILKFRLEAKGTDGADMSRRESQEGTWEFARPGKFSYRAANGAFQLTSDGAKQWTYMGSAKQYTEKAAATDYAKLTPGSMEANAIDSHTPMRILLGIAKTPERMFEKVARWTSATPEERAGEKGTRLTGEIAEGAMGLPGKTVLSAWFEDKSGLVCESRIDMTEAYRSYIKQAIEAKHDAGGQLPESIEVVEIVTDFRNVETGKPPAPDAFAFKPPEGAAKVAYLDPSANGGGSIEELIGKAAPEFSGKLLSGEDFSITSLKGRIVVMDFWATWCGPCMKTIPSMQKISEKYAGQPVTVLGINQDQARSDDQLKGVLEKVKSAVEKNNLTFRHVMDSRGAIGDKYFVNAIPCTVILDQEGVVQDVHVGSPPGGIEEDLSGKIDRLLKGEKLTDKK